VTASQANRLPAKSGVSPLSNSRKVEYHADDISVSSKMKRFQVRWVSVLVAMTLVFAQIGVAAYACPHLGNSPGFAPSAIAEQSEQPGAGRDAQRPAFCHEHCKAQASVDQIQVAGVPPAPPSGLVLPAVNVHQALLRAAYVEPDPTRVNRPPSSILFRVFRN